jgi:hypothetical protein
MSSGWEFPSGQSLAPLQPLALPHGCSLSIPPWPPSAECCVARPTGPVSEPPQPPQLASALCSGLCHVGAGEGPFKPFQQPRAHQSCALKPKRFFGPQPHPCSHTFSVLHLSAPPLWALPGSRHLFGFSPCLLSPRHQGSVATWVPWQPGCHGTVGAVLAEQQLWVTWAGKTQGPASATLRLETPLPSSLSRAEEAMRRKRKLPRRAALYL